MTIGALAGISPSRSTRNDSQDARRRNLKAALVVSFCCSTLAMGFAQQPATNRPAGDISALHESFAHPPADARIMMRWWWFGPSQTKDEIKRELEQMKGAGIGGVEIATLYPLALDNSATGFHNYPFLSDEHVENLRFAAEEAQRLGLRVDITIGTGWPFGGPHIPPSQAAGELRVEAIPVPAGSESVAAPDLESGEQLIAAFITSASDSKTDFARARRLSLSGTARVSLSSPVAEDSKVLFFISSRTGMMVKRPADGGSGFVLDHYDAAATRNHLKTVGDRLLSAFDDHPPHAVFSDSLEDYGSDWTGDLVAEFQRRRGYDLTAHLPALIGDDGPDTAAVRHDWGQTLTELANERFLEPMQMWAHEHHTLLRSQTYGFPPVTLSSNRYADLPEGEGKATLEMWRQFSDTRWAASAGHLFGHNVISSETWTWLHSPAFRATPLDMKAEADLHFLQGVNQVVGHGWPYSPQEAGEPGWRMYAAGAFNAHNPWFQVMPDLTGYLQRASYALRLGRPETDVAILLPNDDVWASFKARIQANHPVTSLGGFDETGSNITIDESLPKFLGSELIPQVLDAGFNFDFVDADAIDTVGIPYKVLILPGVDRIPLSTYKKIIDFARRGGTVFATRRMPATAPGLQNAPETSKHLRALSQELFHSNIKTAHFLQDEHSLGPQLATWIPPDFNVEPPSHVIGFVHRHLDSGDLYFIANTSNKPQSTHATFRASGVNGETWNLFTGETKGITQAGSTRIDLEPYESRVFFFSNGPVTPAPQTHQMSSRSIDISHGWSFRAPGASSQSMNVLTSWTTDPALRYYSGLATYTKEVDLPGSGQTKENHVLLDFGKGTAVPMPDPLPRPNMRAYLESPIREAAAVYVNDALAGYVWHPPYRLDISRFVKPGKNTFRIVVGNTAINELAGTSLPTYRLLYDRFGVEFIPQGLENLEPLPSGMLGPVTLIQELSDK